MSDALRLAAKYGRKIAKSALEHKLDGGDWSLAGTFTIADDLGSGIFRVAIDRADPPRLVHRPTGQKLVVPYRECTTDFASVPVWIQRLSREAEMVHLQARSYELPSLIHDQLYSAAWCYAVSADGHAVRVKVSKSQADAILAVAIACSSATVGDFLAYHGAVRVAGIVAWNLHRRHPDDFPALFDPKE